MVTVREIAGSSGDEGNDSFSAHLVFDVRKSSAESMAAVRAAIVADTPATFDGLARNKYSWQEFDDVEGRFTVKVDYSARLPESTLRLSFDSTGGTVRIYQALAQTKYNPTYAGALPAPDFRKNIPGGVDITVGALKLNYRYKWPANVITSAYVRSVAALAGVTNNGVVDGYAAGSLLFLGCSGEIVPDVPTEIDYSFAAALEFTESFGDFTGVVVGPHDHLWVDFEEDYDDTAEKHVKRAAGAYVARVYRRIAFSTFGIF